MDFTKGAATLCIINTTPQDLILKSGQIIANLGPIELQESNTYPILESKTQGFTLKEHDELINLFKLKADYTLETDDMSEFEDDADIISCSLATNRSKPLGKGELPEAIEKNVLLNAMIPFMRIK